MPAGLFAYCPVRQRHSPPATSPARRAAPALRAVPAPTAGASAARRTHAAGTPGAARTSLRAKPVPIANKGHNSRRPPAAPPVGAAEVRARWCSSAKPARSSSCWCVAGAGVRCLHDLPLTANNENTRWRRCAQVIQCKKCRSIVGDSFSLKLIHRELQLVCIAGAQQPALCVPMSVSCKLSSSPAGSPAGCHARQAPPTWMWTNWLSRKRR